MTARRRNYRAAARVGQAMFMGAVSVLLLFALWQDAPAQPPGVGSSRTIRGTIDRFTTAKKGEVDGCMLEDGTWVHWPPHLGDRVAPLLTKGDRIRVTGCTETDKEGRRKFEAELIVNLRTDRAIALDEFPAKAPKGKKGKKGERVPVGGVTVLRGIVERFTTAPKGEIDGFIMDDGTWVHWPPHLEGQAKGVFGKGDRVRVTGWWETGKKGETKLEAQSVVNLRTDKTVLFDYRQGVAPPIGAGASREERLRALERRLEDLLREIKELRRER